MLVVAMLVHYSIRSEFYIKSFKVNSDVESDAK